MEKKVSVADMKVSEERGDVLIADEIGSGIGIAIYDSVSRVGGLLHFLLPDSAIESKIAQKNPLVFADTAIPVFFRLFSESGGNTERAKILAAGGSQIMDQGENLNIGKQNYIALLNIFDRTGIHADIEAVGGHVNRGLKLKISTGEMFVRSSRAPHEVMV